MPTGSATKRGESTTRASNTSRAPSPTAVDFVQPSQPSAAGSTQPHERKRSRGSTAGSAKGSTNGKDVNGDEGEDQDGGVKRKKRIPQSCTECIRRKIKCDKSQPCSACVRRKRTQYCSYEDEDPESPYALASEVRAINRRLSQLETLFQQGNSPAAFSLPNPNLHLANALPSPANRSQASHAPVPSPAFNSGPRSPSHSDTESAVADIEEAAFAARVPVLRAINAAAQGNARRYNYAGRVDMELTSALTSILAEPLTFDQDGRPRSAVRLGLDLAVSTNDLPSVRHDALAQILAVLPGPDISRFLVTKYFAEIEWDYKVLDPVAFPLELDRYNDMLDQGREDSIDPLWIAVFCMVLTLSLEGFWTRPTGMKDLSLFQGLDEDGLRDLPSVWHDAALRALQLGEYGGTPRIRTIQCVMLFGQYIQISSSSGQNGRFLGWFASAVRVAQRLGLHRLGSNPLTMPPDDPALPPGSSSLKRELAVRLFHHLVNMDSFLSDSPAFRCYLLHPSQYNTARPLNLNLSDFSREENRLLTPAPFTIYTDASYQLVQCAIAEQVRCALDNLVLSDNPFSYPAVIEQDRAFENILCSVPAVFSWELPPSMLLERMAYERACLHEELSSRIVRLNRPLLGRGYQAGSPYLHSTQQCIRYARRLIDSNYELLQISTSLWLMYTGTLASSIVLLMDLFHSIDIDDPESSIREKRDVLAKARLIFETRVATPALAVVVEEGRKILTALFAAEEARRTTRAAFDMTNRPAPMLETFAQVLKRVCRELANEEQPLSQHYSTLPYPAMPHQMPPTEAQRSSTFSPASSFAQSAATAMNPTPFSYSSTPAFDSLPIASELAVGDYSSFLGTLASEDWTATGFGSPSGDSNSLLGQLAATW